MCRRGFIKTLLVPFPEVSCPGGGGILWFSSSRGRRAIKPKNANTIINRLTICEYFRAVSYELAGTRKLAVRSPSPPTVDVVSAQWRSPPRIGFEFKHKDYRGRRTKSRPSAFRFLRGAPARTKRRLPIAAFTVDN